MSQIIENILRDVCLDPRITNGTFCIEEDQHMEVLRDYFLKKGIPQDEIIKINNKILEGKYPQRQAYNKDGILCTFPTPQHKAKAIARGTHFEKNPNPQAPAVEKETPIEKEPVDDKPEPTIDGDEEDSGDEDIKPEPTIFQGDKQLSVEPTAGDKDVPIPAPAPTVPISPRTPERIAAEKEVVNQIMNTDDNVLSDIVPQVNEACKHQLKELYTKADEWGFREAVTFLTPYVKS